MIYEYLCDECHTVTERDLPISKMKKWVKCACGKRASQILSKPSIYYQANFFSLRDENRIRNR